MQRLAERRINVTHHYDLLDRLRAQGHRLTPQRDMIILAMHDQREWSIQRITQAAGCSDRTVRKRRRRGQDDHSRD